MFVYKVEPVRQNLAKVQSDNKSLTESMEALMKVNSEQQGTLDLLKDKVEQQKHLLKQTQQAR